MKVYKFKVKEYTTILIGQRIEPVYNYKKDTLEEGYFFIQRGDGKIFKYNDYRIEWSEIIYTEEE